MFVLADGGRDLESFVLSDYNEAKSLLVQVADRISFPDQFNKRLSPASGALASYPPPSEMLSI